MGLGVMGPGIEGAPAHLGQVGNWLALRVLDVSWDLHHGVS